MKKIFLYVQKFLLPSMLLVLVSCIPILPIAQETVEIPPALHSYIKKHNIDDAVVELAKIEAEQIFDAINDKDVMAAQNYIKETLQSALKNGIAPIAFRMNAANGRSMLYEAIDKQLTSLILPLAILGTMKGGTQLLFLARQRKIPQEIIDVLANLYRAKQKLQWQAESHAPFLQKDPFYNKIKPLLEELRSYSKNQDPASDEDNQDSEDDEWEHVEWEDKDWVFVEPEEQSKPGLFNRIGKKLRLWR